MKPTFVFLPMSNEKYVYLLLLDTGEIVERDNIKGEEMMRFSDYASFKNYYLKLNQRACLPEHIGELFSPYFLAANYLADQHKICDIKAYINDYLPVLETGLTFKIDRDKLGEKTCMLKILNELREEISYDGVQKYEIPILVLYGEHLCRLFPSLKWGVAKDYNGLGIAYYFPILNDEDIRVEVQRVLYNDGDDKIFNFDYLLGVAEVIRNENN